MSHSNKTAGDIFDAAIELPPERRAAWVQAACAGDDASRQRVEALPRARESAGTFMDRPAAAPRNEPAAVRPAEQPGAMIGRYKLLQPIGEGGCGVVYLAGQEEPVRRRAALKVIKLGMDRSGCNSRRRNASRNALPPIWWWSCSTGGMCASAAQSAGGRGLIAGKIVLGWQGDPVEFVRRLNWEAQHGGLGRAHGAH